MHAHDYVPDDGGPDAPKPYRSRASLRRLHRLDDAERGGALLAAAVEGELDLGLDDRSSWVEP